MLISDVEKKKDIYLKNNNFISVEGWIKSIREGKKIIFIELNDGSSLCNLQIIFLKENDKFYKLGRPKLGSYLSVEGFLFSFDKKNIELRVSNIIKISFSEIDNPILQKKWIPLEIVRQFPYLRPKTNLFFLVFKIRDFLSIIINNFFHNNNFLLISTPLMTKIDTEGAGDVFKIFSKKSEEDDKKKYNLTVSGQLHLEFFAQGFSRVYNFSPCFRAEKSHTTRHLSEFWMIEAEFICQKLDELINFTENFFKYIFSSLLNNHYEYLKKLENYLNNDEKKTNGISLLDNLRKISDNNYYFKKISYNEIVNILRDNFFDFEWGDDLNAEQENFICSFFSSPVFITHFPSELKAFYMKENEENQKVVDCFDLVFPKIGEIAGGSMREDNSKILKNKIKKKGLKKMKWYEDLRIYGYGITGGFGLGLERLLMFICGLENIKDVIPFPNIFDDKY